MISRDYCQLMARYNRWMNERLYALLSELPDDERQRDRGQLTALIRQAGRDPGPTDIPWLPGVVRIGD